MASYVVDAASTVASVSFTMAMPGTGRQSVASSVAFRAWRTSPAFVTHLASHVGSSM